MACERHSRSFIGGLVRGSDLWFTPYVCECVSPADSSSTDRRPGGQKTPRTGHHKTTRSTSSVHASNWYKQCKVTTSDWSKLQDGDVCLKTRKAPARSLFAVDALQHQLTLVAHFVSVNHHMHFVFFCGGRDD